MPFFDDLMSFSTIFAPNFVRFDPWVWQKKRSDDVFSSLFPRKGFRASLRNFEVLKKFVMATPLKPFDGIP